MQPILVAAATPELLAEVPGAARMLSDAERDRMVRLRFDRDRDDFVAAHVLARACAAAVLDLPASRLTWRQRCPECGGPHGRPSVAEAPELGVSLAHASGYVAAAAAPGPVGVDLEAFRSGHGDRELARDRPSQAAGRVRDACTGPDVAFLRQWVRREALVKVGALTLDTLWTADLAHLPPGEPAEGWAEHHWDRFVIADWRFGPALGAMASTVPVRQGSMKSVLSLH